MKFIYAKKAIVCKHCKTIIERAEVFIRTSHRNKSTGSYYSFSYHYECYIEYFTERIRKDALYWIGQQLPPKRLGRPRKYINPKKADRLGALLRYHKKAGNVERAKEVETQLRRLVPGANI